MLKGINQSMVNRSIAGGGSNCKCINGNGISGGSNGSGVNGGKITVEFTIHEERIDIGSSKAYFKKDDAEKLFKEMLSVDMENYMFYLSTVSEGYIVNGVTTYPTKYDNSCDQTYTKGVIEGESVEVFIIAIGGKNESISFTFDIQSVYNSITYHIDYNEKIVNIVDTIPDAAKYEHTYRLTLYYRER